MINFFRNIRRQLASEKKFQKYFRYALGEIVLVVIGILIALQINNWNEERKQDESFNILLEQLYNDFDLQAQSLSNTEQFIEAEIDYIDKLLMNPETIEPTELPYVLIFIDFTYDMEKIKIQNPFDLLSQLESLSFNANQIKLLKKIRASFSNTYWNSISKGEIIKEIFNDSIIPIPRSNRGQLLSSDFREIDSSFYTHNEIEKIKNMITSPKINSVLRTLKKDKESFLSADIPNLVGDTNSILDLIEQYNQEIHLLYNNIGIIGSAISGWEDSTPMTLTNVKSCIWEMDIPLKEGTVKFRSENSWNENWGGSFVNSTFPKGQTTFFGGDIPVEEGQYHVVLNLKEKTYEFIKQDD